MDTNDRTCDYTVYDEIAYRVSEFEWFWLRSDEKPLISAIDIEGELSAVILAKRSFLRQNKWGNGQSERKSYYPVYDETVNTISDFEWFWLRSDEKTLISVQLECNSFLCWNSAKHCFLRSSKWETARYEYTSDYSVYDESRHRISDYEWFWLRSDEKKHSFQSN